MNDPTAALAPIRNAGLQGINQTYAGVPQQVTQQLANRGYGSSGATGDALYKVGLSRAGAVSGLEGQLATQGIQQQQFGASLGEQLLNSLKGSTTSTSGTTSTDGSTTGTQTKPGPSIFSSIAGLGSMLFGLGGGGGGGGSDTSGYGGGSAGPNGQYNVFGGPNSVGTATNGF
jgi:hypothetical protein